MKHVTFAAVTICLLTSYILHAQHYSRTDTIPVYRNGDTLKFPWAGGHNFVQLSDIDLNFDGIKDLFVFDRSGNKVTTYLNGGTPNKVDYTHAFQYQNKFPLLQFWALLTDYNCDGKEDIFTSSVSPSGIRVYENTSSGGNLQFTLVSNALSYSGGYIPANTIGLPAIEDIDGDGDLDILTFTTGSNMMDYYINQSKELYGNCDSLVFIKDPPCWGHFAESGSLCTVILGSCRIGNVEYTPTDSLSFASRTGDNGSSCSLCLDMDGDGDKELLIGQGNCCSINLLTNGGSPSSANMTSFTKDFPDSIIPVNMRYNPCGYFLDVDNDNKRDLIVCPSIPNVSLNTEDLWFYKNMGADNAPVFSRQTRSFLQENMIEAGESADPVFFDYDNDGLTDLLISNYIVSKDSCPASYSYGVFAYKNIGTAASPKFNLTTTNYANLAGLLPNITNKHLTFGDVDGDGDADMFIGDYNGLLSYAQNTAPAGNPASFPVVQDSVTDCNNLLIDVGSHATPQLIDMDRDGDLDLIIGERSGNLNYYQNIGTPTVPSYSLITTSFGNVDVMVPCCTGFSEPFVYDSAGSYRMIVGSEASRTPPFYNGLWFYNNIDGNLGGTFNRVDSAMQNIWEGTRMLVNGKDITGDGRMDLVIGNLCGGVAIYLGDTLTTGINEPKNDDFDFSIYPNPGDGKFQVSSLKSQVSRIEVFNIISEKVFDLAIQPSNHSAIEITLPSGLGHGIYFVKASGEKFTKTKKLVVVR